MRSLIHPLHWFCILTLAGLGCGLASAETAPEASPSFTLTASRHQLNLTSGGAVRTISVSAKGLNGFNGTIAVKVSGLPARVVASPSGFTLKAGQSRAINLSAPAGIAAENTTAQFTGTSGALHKAAPLALFVTTPIDVATYQYDQGRTGLNPRETILTPANVNKSRFGLLGTIKLDGVVDAQPLFLSNVDIGSKLHNVVYTVSEHDTVYAFDADNGASLWRHSVLGAKETTSGDFGCGQISPEIGITSTPVIDRKYGAHGAIFLVGMTADQSGNHHQRLHALDLVTGAELPHSPVEIKASYPGTGDNSSNGRVIFDPAQYAERAGLLLLNGTIYLSWTSHCDSGPYTGWLMGYSESTLAQTQVLNLTPNGSEGSIWMSGSGLAADAQGNIYFLDANGTFDGEINSKGFPIHSDYGNGFIKVSTAAGKLAVADYFEMYNTISESNNDADLGSGGVILLPDLKDSKGGVHHLAVGAGKDGNIYVVNRDNMGKFNPNNDNAIYQELDNAVGGVWSKPAYFNNTVYYAANGDTLKAFQIANAKLIEAPVHTSANGFEYPGAKPTISANGLKNGIVWAVENSNQAVLHAYEAGNLEEIYNSNQAGNRDHFGSGNKFITPLEVDGKVYVGTPGGIAVFGLAP